MFSWSKRKTHTYNCYVTALCGVKVPVEFTEPMLNASLSVSTGISPDETKWLHGMLVFWPS